MIVIDTHSHFVPETFPERPSSAIADEWPEMIALDDGRARMMIAGKEFRVFEPTYWDVARRVELMDGEGVAIQVISPLPELLGYWFNAATAAAVARHMHRSIAAAVANAPTRLAGLGMLPLQNLDLSLEIIAEIADTGLKGVLIGSNVNGVSIADPRFDPLYAELERRGLAVMVHGYRPGALERFVGPPFLAPILGVPQDAAAALGSFMMTDIFGRFPALKLDFAHGGGSFGASLARMTHIWTEFPQMRAAMAESPRDYVRRFHFDNVVFGADYLRFLLDAYGSEGMMTGSDGPTASGQCNLAAFIADACEGDEATAEKIAWRNAARFFDLDKQVAHHRTGARPQ